MDDPNLSLLQQAIQTRAAELRAVAAESDMRLTELVEATRRLDAGSERLRRERYRARADQRANEPGEDR